MTAKRREDSERKFEELLAELETLVSSMESAEPDLEASLKAYERGMELSRECHKRLEEAERRILMLRKSADGKVTAEPFGEESE